MSKRLHESAQPCTDLLDELWLHIFFAWPIWSRARCICRRFDHLIRNHTSDASNRRRKAIAQRFSDADFPYASLDAATASLEDIKRRLKIVPHYVPVMVCRLSELLQAPATFELYFRIVFHVYQRKFGDRLYEFSEFRSPIAMKHLFLAVASPQILELWPYDLYKKHVRRADNDNRRLMCTTPFYNACLVSDGAELRTESIVDFQVDSGVDVVARDTPFTDTLSGQTAKFVRFNGNIKQLRAMAQRLSSYRVVRDTTKKWFSDYIEKMLLLRDCK